VLDGELVIWGGDRLDFSALQQRAMSPRQGAVLARRQPASYVAFDVLAVSGQDWRDQPLPARRRRLEALEPGLAPPLQVSPATTDPAVAAVWATEYGEAEVGIEGQLLHRFGEHHLLGPGQHER
jgi:ATP-dependent DNA ligase